MTDQPIGKPFSRVYNVPTQLLPDSVKLRRRLGAYFAGWNEDFLEKLSAHLLKEHGIIIPYELGGCSPRTFFERANLSDLLDSITGIFVFMVAARLTGVVVDAKNWQDFVSRVLTEESIGYILDAKCGIHYRVDTQFELNRVATLKGLGKPRYAAARQAFEDGMAALDGTTPKTLSAVRGVFEANENVFILTLGPKVNRLTRGHIENHLKPLVESQYDGRDKLVAERMQASFSDWVDGVHNYRHAPGVPDPSPPPLELAVAIIDTGTAYLRWLIEIDVKALESKP